jgi:crotonobetainyl-CoA:carnitine CoA-transferase CaiB-like acyl-CoA transferase
MNQEIPVIGDKTRLQPLNGLLVVAVEQAVAAPLCTARLVDAGARVIKVERLGGDFARGYDQAALGDSSYFAWTNHGKESVELDFKRPEDAALLHRILVEADVFIQNLAPGALSRAGFDSAELRSKHSRLITCDISGYGASEAMRGMKAYDLLVQAESALVSVSGAPGEPGRIGVSLCDIGAGVTAHAGILEALIQRGLTGRGCGIAVSLFDVAAEWMSVPLIHAETGDGAPLRVGLKHPSIAPYGAFPDADGTLTLISIQNEREWVRLCDKVLQCPELASDPRFDSNLQRVANRDALDRAVGERTSTLSTGQLRSSLKSASIAYGALNSVDDLAAHAALRRRQITNSIDRTLSLPAHPVQVISETVHRSGSVIPDARDRTDSLDSGQQIPSTGQHTAAIRDEFTDDNCLSDGACATDDRLDTE